MMMKTCLLSPLARQQQQQEKQQRPQRRRVLHLVRLMAPPPQHLVVQGMTWAPASLAR
jgi:hypothetical protein